MAHVALLRAVNLGPHNKVPMAEFRMACAQAGLGEVRTYIASGNIVLDSASDPSALEAAIEDVVAARFGVSAPAIVRDAAQWRELAICSPFPQAERDEPNRLMLCLSKRPLPAGAALAIQDRALAGERVVQERGALWVHYPEGAGTSRLSPALFDRAAGSPVTARNWRTVVKLQEMLAA